MYGFWPILPPASKGRAVGGVRRAHGARKAPTRQRGTRGARVPVGRGPAATLGRARCWHGDTARCFQCAHQDAWTAEVTPPHSGTAGGLRGEPRPMVGLVRCRRAQVAPSAAKQTQQAAAHVTSPAFSTLPTLWTRLQAEGRSAHTPQTCPASGPPEGRRLPPPSPSRSLRRLYRSSGPGARRTLRPAALTWTWLTNGSMSCAARMRSSTCHALFLHFCCETRGSHGADVANASHRTC